ncbi:MAG: lysophospholipase [Chromatiales bacterium]|nr:lysophospholipase [Chromatiales bacterium]
MSSPAYAQIGSPSVEHGAEAVVFENVHGWYYPTQAHKACILLMHGIRSNRKEMVGRAIFLQEEGYSSFAVDLQAHGETPGERITYGYQESESAHSAVRFLYTHKGCSKVVSLGSSLGGAASLLGNKPIEVDGYILEAVYPSIENAVQNRLKIRLGTLGQILAPLLYQQIPLRLGITLNSLQPVAAIKNVNSPILIMNGTEDEHTTIEEAKSLYNNAPHPKEFVQIDGASHTDLYNYNRDQYKKAVLDFLSKYVD